MRERMKKLYAALEKVSFLSLPLCWCSLVLLDVSFRYFYRFLSDTATLSLKPMLFTCGWAALLTALIALLPRLGRRIAMMALVVIFSLLEITHGALYNVTGHFFSFSDLNYAGDGAKFFSWTYLNLRKALLLCILLAVLVMAFAAFITRPVRDSRKRKLSLLAAGLVAGLSVVPIAVVHNRLMPQEDSGMWWGSTYDPAAASYKTFTDPNRCLMLTGLYQYTFRNGAVSLGLGVDRDSVEKLDAFFQARGEQISGDNDRTASLQGKNLIMVMVESLDTWMVTPEYTPTLYALQQQGVNFEHFYTPLYLSAGTFNTEIITQTGLIPAVSGLSSSAYSTNRFPLSLAHVFEKAGYTANSFHSASPAIYSRGTVHLNLGFEAYTNYVGMGMDDYQLDAQMIGGYDQMVPDEGNFFTYVITYSGHGPYTEEMGNIAVPHWAEAQAAVAASGVTGSAADMDEYTRAVAHIMETDEFVEKLVSRLEAEGRLEDTVLVFYGDHYSKYMSNKHFLNEIKGVTADDPVELFHTPCFLYGGGLAPETVEKYCSSVDLVPTLANLFGLPTDRRYYMGDDIFGDKGGVVMLPNYQWYDGVTYYRGEATEDPTLLAVTADVTQRMDASMDALKCDYFKNWSQGDR